jgi:RecA/RadA recombinase
VRRAWLVAGVVGLAGALLAGGCESAADRAAAIYTGAGAGKTAVATAIVADWRAGRTTMDAVLSLAHIQVEKIGDGQSVTFAAGVLDAAKTLESELTQKGANEFLWMRLGTLAGSAAARAFAAGDERGALTLATAGPVRWQTDMYWIRNPSHDALVSFLMARAGNKNEALARIRDRVENSDELKAAYEAIQKMP